MSASTGSLVGCMSMNLKYGTWPQRILSVFCSNNMTGAAVSRGISSCKTNASKEQDIDRWIQKYLHILLLRDP